ncbi:MAG: amidohydrolase [Deltaproteobacteria bacterium]|nr:amidohydrolase [Deltaproteobacteria bacterium]
MIIDADAHVEESEAMFERLDKEFRARRPLPIKLERDTVYGRYNAVWLIDGETYPKMVGKGGTIFRTPTLMEAATQKRESIGAQEITDVAARIKDMDKVKIDTQVVFPSLFLTHTADDVKLEAALLRAYNTFLGECAVASKNRIRFAALVPIRDMAASIKEIQRCAKIGAAAVMLQGLAWDKLLGDESLFPFYEVAADFNLPLCVHLGWGCPALTRLFDASTNFYSAILPVVMGFNSIMSSAAFEKIPKLRFSFLEAGAAWIPFMLKQVRRDNARRKLAQDPVEYFKTGRVFVSAEPDEDMNGIAALIGEDSFVLGSDYPHGDPSRQEDMVAEFRERDDLPKTMVEKMLSDNPRRLYGM